MTSTVTTIRTLRLQRGQALHVALDAGTVLQVDAGALTLREPMRWLGETLVTPAIGLTEGQCHALTGGGWCVLEACGGDATLLQHPPPARWPGLWRRLRPGARLSRRTHGIS